MKTLTLQVKSLVDELVDADVDVSAREIARRLQVATTTITRDAERMALVLAGKKRLQLLRAHVEKQEKNSRSQLMAKIAKQEAEIEELQRRLNLVLFSHKRMIMAIGEQGFAAHRRFFATYREIEAELEQMGAYPSAQVTLLKGEKLKGHLAGVHGS